MATNNEVYEMAEQYAAQQAAQNSGFYNNYIPENGGSSKEFYLGYEDLLQDTIESWRGKIKQNGEWKEINGTAVMSEEAITVVTNLMRSFLSVPNRLANQEPKYINLYAFQARKHISRFLHTRGWLEYRIPIEQLRIISFQCGQIIHAALTWSKEGGGQRFINRSIISHENVSHIISGMKGQTNDAESEKFRMKQKMW